MYINWCYFILADEKQEKHMRFLWEQARPHTWDFYENKQESEIAKPRRTNMWKNCGHAPSKRLHDVPKLPPTSTAGHNPVHCSKTRAAIHVELRSIAPWRWHRTAMKRQCAPSFSCRAMFDEAGPCHGAMAWMQWWLIGEWLAKTIMRQKRQENWEKQVWPWEKNKNSKAWRNADCTFLVCHFCRIWYVLRDPALGSGPCCMLISGH